MATQNYRFCEAVSMPLIGMEGLEGGLIASSVGSSFSGYSRNYR
jgi:hypothetical protein